MVPTTRGASTFRFCPKKKRKKKTFRFCPKCTFFEGEKVQGVFDGDGGVSEWFDGVVTSIESAPTGRVLSLEVHYQVDDSTEMYHLPHDIQNLRKLRSESAPAVPSGALRQS